MPQSITLFCLPYAGGNSYVYKKFAEYHSNGVTIAAIDLPGHGKYFRKAPLTNIHDMAEYVFHEIHENLHKPYAIYGHSMGTLIGYVLTQKISQEHLPLPRHLFLSGRQGPAVRSKEENWHLLPKDIFLKKVMAYGGIPEQVAAEEELMDFFIPILKADFQAVSDYKHEQAQPLHVPVTVLIGQDDNITYAEALQWQDVTTQKIAVKQFPGNHFFIFDYLPEIGATISRILTQP